MGAFDSRHNRKTVHRYVDKIVETSSRQDSLHAKPKTMKDFLFTLLAWLFTLPVIAGSVIFSLYNPERYPVVFNPFKDAIELPLYVPVLGGVAFGFLFGAIMTWAAMGRLRSQCRAQQKEIKALQKQVSNQNNKNIKSHNYALIPSAFTERK